MTECVDPIAVDVRDGAGTAEHQVAADQHHADRVARLERTLVRLLAKVHARDAAAGRNESLIAEGAAEHVGEIGLEARHHERRRDRPKQRAQLWGGHAGDGR